MNKDVFDTTPGVKITLLSLKSCFELSGLASGLRVIFDDKMQRGTLEQYLSLNHKSGRYMKVKCICSKHAIEKIKYFTEYQSVDDPTYMD